MSLLFSIVAKVTTNYFYKSKSCSTIRLRLLLNTHAVTMSIITPLSLDMQFIYNTGNCLWTWIQWWPAAEWTRVQTILFSTSSGGRDLWGDFKTAHWNTKEKFNTVRLYPIMSVTPVQSGLHACYHNNLVWPSTIIATLEQNLLAVAKECDRCSH